MKRHLSTLFMSFALLGLLSASPALATPIIGSSVLDQGDGTFLYSYDVFNPAASTENLFDFGLYFDGMPTTVQAPAGWDHIEGLGFIDWFSLIDPVLGPVYDLTAGSTLRGFSFVSAFAPGPITFSSLGADALTGDVGVTEYGPTTGPVSAVPEPGSLFLLGTGGLGAWLARRRSSRPIA